MISRTSQPDSHPQSGKISGSHRILVVDDEPAILFAYRKLIEKDGIVVDISTNLDDALRLIEVYRYLAVIADLRLAGTDNGDGLEILRFIQRERPGIKSILATGYGSSEVEHMARTLGVSYCFNKPVQPADILAAIQEFCVEYAVNQDTIPS
jgi:DNA-binding NtrC family response regulator